MMRLGSCIEMMFTEYPFLDRIARAADAGFSAVEFWGWRDKDLDGIAGAAERAGIIVSDCCVGTADEARDAQFAKGAMLRSENAALFAEMVEETINAVSRLGVKTLIATTGQAIPGMDRQSQQDSVVACLKAADPVLGRYGCTLVLEPLNTLDHHGYYLDTSKLAFEILRQVDSPNVRLLYDIYHQQITEGNLIRTITENIALIGHFHVADVPSHNEPGTGEINYRNVLAAIKASGYDGLLGCEYWPSRGNTMESAREILRLAAMPD